MKLNTKDFEARMDKAIAALNSNFDTVRAGQASAAVLNRVTFEYYGAQTPLKDMADIRQADSRTLEIKPYDGSTLKAMEKAILASDVGITPANDGTKLRLVFPSPPRSAVASFASRSPRWQRMLRSPCVTSAATPTI